MQRIDSLGFSFSINPKNGKLKKNKKVAKFFERIERLVARDIEKQLTPEVLWHISCGLPYYIDGTKIVLVGGAHDVHAD